MSEAPVNYEKNVSEPWFSLIALGCKTIEGRLDTGDFAKMRPGDTITFQSGPTQKVVVRITDTKHYSSFRDYLGGETLARALPTIANIDDGVEIYRQYYSEKDEKEHGVVAIYIERVNK